MDDRASLLARVARYELPLTDTLALLQAYGWDSDTDHHVLSPTDATGVLDRFLSGELTAAQLTHWAELLEMRDDLAFDPQTAQVLQQLIFLLANPGINGEITHASIATLRARLSVT